VSDAKKKLFEGLQELQATRRRTQMVQRNKEYTYDEVFESIPGDNDNVLLNLPDELCEEVGLCPGDTVTVKLINGSLVISKV